MTDLFTKPFTDLFKTTTSSQLPAQVQTLVQDGLSKTRQAALTSITAIKDGAEQLGKVNLLAPKEAAEFTAKLFDNTLANTEAAFVAAQAITKAQSPIEAMQLQTAYSQSQFAKAGEQTKELFELSTKAAHKSAEDFGGIARKAAAGRKG